MTKITAAHLEAVQHAANAYGMYARETTDRAEHQPMVSMSARLSEAAALRAIAAGEA